MNTRELGQQEEKFACEHLEKAGYQVLTRNWYFHRLGELDIVAKCDDLIIFMEVRSLNASSSKIIKPQQILPWLKVRRLRRLAEAWLIGHGFSSFKQRVRGDLLVMRQREVILWLKAAF